MSTEKQIFYTIYGKQQLERQEVSKDCCVKDFVDETLKQLGIKDVDGFNVHLEGKDDAIDISISVVDLPDDKPIHIGRCSKVNVTIYYLDKKHVFTVSPATLIADILDKAIKHYDLKDVQSKDYVLQLGEKAVNKSLPIGTLVKDEKCSVELNLVPAEKWQG